eukprot:8460739-Pyramimonas_sp.AAC.1
MSWASSTAFSWSSSEMCVDRSKRLGPRKTQTSAWVPSLLKESRTGAWECVDVGRSTSAVGPRAAREADITK